ncbi:MAG: c-type cytochrome [Polaribacter sp.]|nr:c-type cytochrome [Polaribacter sp.]
MRSVDKHSQLIKLLLKRVTFLFIFSLSFFVQAQDAVDAAQQKEGRKLFKSQCAACHKLDKKFVGPALGNIAEKREADWLVAWIKDNAALIKSGDKDAIEAAEFSPSAMTAFPRLTDKNIEDLIYYTTVGDPVKATATGAVAAEATQETSPWLAYILIGIIVFGILIIANLLKVISELKGAPKTPGLASNLNELWIGFKRNSFLHALLVVFFLLTTAYVLFGSLFKMGVDTGYQPIQPIAFSHTIHAGDNKIDCEYCHSSAKHSKTSGIPSANVCMNCHKNISEVADDTKMVLDGVTLGKVELDAEIQKLYAATGWDSETLAYTGETAPIKWVRVHNLPDFAYYNHSQHVTVAGLKCQKCHGPVETMDEVYQFSSLTMGWCIDCHKETKVDLKGNDYYTKIHEQLSQKYGVDQVSVAQLGGKECGKCHY